MIENFFAAFGSPVVSFYKSLEKLGAFILFQLRLIPSYFVQPLRIAEIAKQTVSIGANSSGIIILTAAFIGMIQAIQAYHAMHKVDLDNLMGYPIFYAVGRELGPVISALMVTSRSISAMAAELGTMRVTEQIDAIETLGINSKKLLIVPRIIAAGFSLPLLIAMFDVVSNLCAFFIAVALNVNPTAYLDTITKYAEFSDYSSGLIKGFFFGIMIAQVGSYVGYFAKGGAKGVGEATTLAVVISSVMILVADYFFSSFFMYLDY